MKPAYFSMALGLALFVSACNNDSTSPGGTATANSDQSDKTGTTAVPAETAKGNSSVNAIVGHYMHVKDALAGDNGSEAAAGAKAMVAELSKVDASGFTQEQQKTYADVSDDLKEMAEHIAESASKIDHQREHFVMMSDDVKALVKSFGWDAPLYVGHCPMANGDKGADWLSKEEAISNPYMGKKMPKCGNVKEVIK
ncbi:DUF3347 domain-containing protein [Flaviaesturariibacter amylovorans]|uniref:DUF3347 domain-containing protein n=1 Tax=Flaviaesturariibacter amylovorans TaxID=1084520 RepID=A0ABP8HLH5_9BACT